MQKPTRLLTAFLGLAVLLSACGRLSGGGGGGGGTTPGGIEHPTGPRDLILRVFTTGGFVPPEWLVAAIPQFTLTGDGWVIVPGPQIELYPPPAIPPLVRFHVTEAGIQAILEAAREAGLFGPDATYGNDCVADAGTTTFTLVAEGRTHTISAYALELTDEGNCATDEAKAAREKLRAFQAEISDLRSWLPEGSVGEEEMYEPSAYRIYALPYDLYQVDEGVRPGEKAWPLATPLASFGEAVDVPPQSRCGVVEGEDLATLLPALRESTTITKWTSEGEEYRLVVRPLLPDESGCPEPTS